MLCLLKGEGRSGGGNYESGREPVCSTDGTLHPDGRPAVRCGAVVLTALL